MKPVLCLLFLTQSLLVATLGSETGNDNLALKWMQKSTDLQRKYRDCHERWKLNGETVPGVYTIYPNGTYPVQVFCDHSVNATYTIIQRRLYGTESFVRPLRDYQQGFGSPQGDYWLGLDNINHLTSTGNKVLRIDMQDWSSNKRYAQYKNFFVSSAAYYYQMTVSGFSGNVLDDLTYQNGMYFYTYDYPDYNGCATNQQAGWWYNYCSYALLNGKYYYGGPYTPTGQFFDGIYWRDWHGYDYSLKFVSMKLSKY